MNIIGRKKSDNLKLEWTGERYVPQLRGSIGLEHLHRYAYACQLVTNKTVLDIACGEGYGTEMLSRSARRVYGVDNNRKTIAHAKNKYGSYRVKFLEGSCQSIPLSDGSVDVVVSFETIEHITEHEKMLGEIRRVLRPGGVLIISSPDKEQYDALQPTANRFHQKELGLAEFESLLEGSFKNCRFFGQRTVSGSEIYGLGTRPQTQAVFEFGSLPDDSVPNKKCLKPTYIVAVCSDHDLPTECESFCVQMPWESDWGLEIQASLSEKDSKLKELGSALVSRDERVAGLTQSLAERDERVAGLTQSLAERDEKITAFDCGVEQRDSGMSPLSNQVETLSNMVKELRASTSWKITAPLRWIAASGKRLVKKTSLLPSRLKLRLSHSRLANNRAVCGVLSWMERFTSQINRLPYAVRILFIHRHSGLFASAWYLQQNLDIRARTKRPLLHFALHGVFEGRAPHAGFDPAYYAGNNPDVATACASPLLHYVLWGYRENRSWRPAFSWNSGENTEITRPISRANTSPDAEVETDVRAIAIYLPQFHAIPENDEWWSKGFTEWTNVRRAVPQYEGHYQPHVPHPDLGYYDLNDVSVLEKQAAMARAAGIEGFCFYYYWFNGKRLLEMPTDRLLATGRPDFPFCFCWANEDWTRTWDGAGNKILIGQDHSPESDKRFIHDLLPALRDKRYIRVDGKPLLIVYRPTLLPEALETTRLWRKICRDEGVGEIFLAYMRGFEWPEPASIGFDAAIQFPPLTADAPIINDTLEIKHPESFRGLVRDYKELPRIFDPARISERVWPCVCPSWDNTARRMEWAHSWANATPESYYRWLSKVVSNLGATQPPDRRLVFINAWNEWAEGCHLEPDQKFGYAWLNATRSALRANPLLAKECGRLQVAVVAHDAARAGAQMLLLTILREWKKRDDVEFRLILVGDGVLRPHFESICKTLVLADYSIEKSRNRALETFLEEAPQAILANTVVVGPLLAKLKGIGVPIVTCVHELQKSIERWAPGQVMASTLAHTNHFLAGAKPVATNLIENHAVDRRRVSVQEAFIQTGKHSPPSSLASIRNELGLGPSDKVVFGCGTMDWRKGPDLFVSTANRVQQKMPAVRFIWIGPLGADESARAALAMAKNPRINFVGERKNIFDYFSVGSIFFLSSREDPFPLVALEAADAGLPIVCFSDAGGMPEFVGQNCGRTVPFEDTNAAAEAIVTLLSDNGLRDDLGRAAQTKVRDKHDAASGSAAVLDVLQSLCDSSPCSAISVRGRNCEQPLVSVIVPNYNHAKFLPERLASIADQSYRNLEIILLDDQSSDRSLEILRNFASSEARARLLANAVNSGSTFKQWRKGLAEAKGKYVWIAESDDSAHPELLKTLVARLEANPNATLATCCPRMTSLEGKDLGIPGDWFSDIGGSRWESDFSSPGRREIAEVMAQKNAILNASGVVFRNKPGLLDLVDDSMRLCADWLFWVRLLARGDFEYTARPVNYWRLASSNARTKSPGEIEWEEGSRVLVEVCRILGPDGPGESRLLEQFRKRCNGWKEKHEQQQSRSFSANGSGTLRPDRTMTRFWRRVRALSARALTSYRQKSPNVFLQREGWCPICEREVTFSSKHAWLRDHYLCSSCGSIPRERALMHVIQTRYPHWRELRIHESSPGNRGASVKLREQCRHYTATQYDPVLNFGKIHPTRGYRSEDLEKQTFGDEEFDLVVTQDVMEHIFDAGAAFREIHRTLKRGGAHIFTTPLVNKGNPSQCRAERKSDNTIIHHFPPEYHGNPMTPEGSLVTWHWGFDIVKYVQRVHAGVAELGFTENPLMGIEGEYLEVIIQSRFE